jgi:hypothetical protein
MEAQVDAIRTRLPLFEHAPPCLIDKHDETSWTYPTRADRLAIHPPLRKHTHTRARSRSRTTPKGSIFMLYLRRRRYFATNFDAFIRKEQFPISAPQQTFNCTVKPRRSH